MTKGLEGNITPTLDDLLQELLDLRKEHGGDLPVVAYHGMEDAHSRETCLVVSVFSKPMIGYVKGNLEGEDDYSQESGPLYEKALVL